MLVGTASLLRDLVGAAQVQLPAIGVLDAAVVVLVMLVPRWSVGLSWALVVGSIVVGPMFGPSLGLPTWLLELSPFTRVPDAPAVPLSVGPVVGLCLALVGPSFPTAAMRSSDADQPWNVGVLRNCYSRQPRVA